MDFVYSNIWPLKKATLRCFVQVSQDIFRYMPSWYYFSNAWVLHWIECSSNNIKESSATACSVRIVNLYSFPSIGGDEFPITFCARTVASWNGLWRRCFLDIFNRNFFKSKVNHYLSYISLRLAVTVRHHLVTLYHEWPCIQWTILKNKSINFTF